MALRVRRSQERGHFDHGWLNTYHTFSFGDYHDREHMGFGALRVINEDRVAPGQGFGTHPHRDMEIISYPVSGQIAHKDSMGNVHTVGRGEVQAMSAGTGVFHSEFNPLADTVSHFLQIWIRPDRPGRTPAYSQRAFPEHERRGRLRLIASPDGAEGSLTIGQDARVYAGLFLPGEAAALPLATGRRAWVQVVGGNVSVNGVVLHAGDGLAMVDEPTLSLTADKHGETNSGGAEVLVFDLP